MLLITLLTVAFIAGVPAQVQNAGGTGKVLVGPNCSGKYLAGGALSPGGSWALYYSDAAGGTNCLVVRNRSGGAQTVDVGIRSGGDFANDAGEYSVFAAVSVGGTAGKCISYHVGYANYWVGDVNVFCK